jgi:hypothetical protein
VRIILKNKGKKRIQSHDTGTVSCAALAAATSLMGFWCINQENERSSKMSRKHLFDTE